MQFSPYLPLMTAILIMTPIFLLAMTASKKLVKQKVHANNRRQGKR